MFAGLCNYGRKYFSRKEAIRAVLARERRVTEAAWNRLEMLKEERETRNAVLRSGLEVTKKTG